MLQYLRSALSEELEDGRPEEIARAKRKQIILDSLHPKQRNFVVDPCRRVAALVSRGGGKTTGVRARLALRLDNTPKARCLYVATTRDQAIDLMWNPLKDLLDRLNVSANLNETSLRCTFPSNRSSLRLVGADDKRQIEKYRGQPFHEVWIDESASYPPSLLSNLIERIIAPRLGELNGMLGMVGTPGHDLRGPFYDATRPGSDAHRKYEDRDLPEYAEWKKWSFHRWALEDGAPYVPALAALLREQKIEIEAKGWSENHPIVLREYKAQWAADDEDHVFRYAPHDSDGKPWNQWTPEFKMLGNRDPRRFAILPDTFADWHYVLGMDQGHADPLAIGIYAYSPSDPAKRLIHVYEFEQRGMYAKTIAELIIGEDLDPDNPGGIVGAIGWPERMVADAGKTLLDELANVYGIRMEQCDKRTENRVDSIELANGDMIEGRIWIIKGSRLAEQLMNLQWTHDDFGKKSKDKGARDDQADQFIYARRAAHHLHSDAPQIATPGHPRPDPSDYRVPKRPDEDEFESILSDGFYDDSGALWD